MKSNRIFLGTKKLILKFAPKIKLTKRARKIWKKIAGIGWDGREVNTTNLLTIELWKFSIGHE